MTLVPSRSRTLSRTSHPAPAVRQCGKRSRLYPVIGCQSATVRPFSATVVLPALAGPPGGMVLAGTSLNPPIRTATSKTGITRGMGTVDSKLSLGSAAGRGTLAAAILASGMAFLDSTVVSVALPALGRDLRASLAE